MFETILFESEISVEDAHKKFKEWLEEGNNNWNEIISHSILVLPPLISGTTHNISCFISVVYRKKEGGRWA